MDPKHDKAFQTMKALITKETLLAYTDFNKPFLINTDASKVQLGAYIMQGNIPLAFYSRKLQAQTRYTITENEILSVVETFKEFRNILLGQQIVVYADHMKLTYKQFNTDCILHWHLYIKEYNPKV